MEASTLRIDVRAYHGTLMREFLQARQKDAAFTFTELPHRWFSARWVFEATGEPAVIAELEKAVDRFHLDRSNEEAW
jgi:hypothetical protein